MQKTGRWIWRWYHWLRPQNNCLRLARLSWSRRRKSAATARCRAHQCCLHVDDNLCNNKVARWSLSWQSRPLCSNSILTPISYTYGAWTTSLREGLLYLIAAVLTRSGMCWLEWQEETFGSPHMWSHSEKFSPHQWSLVSLRFAQSSELRWQTLRTPRRLQHLRQLQSGSWHGYWLWQRVCRLSYLHSILHSCIFLWGLAFKGWKEHQRHHLTRVSDRRSWKKLLPSLLSAERAAMICNTDLCQAVVLNLINKVSQLCRHIYARR